MATYSSSCVGVTRLVLRRTPLASCVATYSSSSGVGVTRLVLQRTPRPPASCVAMYSSSSGVGVTRLVLRRTPPPPALVSRDLCCDVLLRRWCQATGVATYPFSHVKSKRLLPLVGNPRHLSLGDVRSLIALVVWGVNNAIPKLSRRRRRSSLPSRRRQTVSNFEWD